MKKKNPRHKPGKFKIVITAFSLILAILIVIEGLITVRTVIKNRTPFCITQDTTSPLLDRTNGVYFSIIQISERFMKEDINSPIKFFDCSLVNTKDSALVSWKLNLKIPENAYLENYWNCEIQHNEEDNSLEILPKVGLNNKIESNDDTTFGFILVSDVQPFFKSVKISGFFSEHFMDNKFLRNIFILIILMILVMLTFLATYRYSLKQLQINRKQIAHVNTIIDQTMKTFANFIDNKDSYTRGHSSRVAAYSKEIAKRMNLQEYYQQSIYYSALMHDIGKITIPDEVLNKTSHLSDSEWELIKKHTENGALLLKDFTIIPMIKNAVLYHHERFDGTGYPQRLKGNSIPLEARIVCIADSYDAMATTRCYRLEYSEERILSELQRCAGKQFDPSLVPIMMEIIKDGTIYKLTEQL